LLIEGKKVVLSEYIVDVDEKTFESEVVLRSHEVPVIVDFWATWCGPCRTLGPLLERLTIEGGGTFRLAKVNVDENPSLAIRFGVQGIPAVKAFKNGDMVSQFVGAQPEPLVRRFISEIVPGEADKALDEARSLLATRQWVDAENAFRQIFEKEDTNSAAALGVVHSLLMQGRGSEALKILNNFPAGEEWATAEQLKPLATLVSEVESDGPYPADDPLAASLYQAGRLVVSGNHAAAMDGMLDILRQDKRYREGLVKEVMLGIFILLGDEDQMTRDYRNELASVLF
jgi:putative thioredoxin